jgi:Tol biopolymer transport system component
MAFMGQKTDTLRALFTVKMNGTHFRRITSFTLNVGSRVDWAPDGGHIVFTEYQNDGPGNTALVRPDGSDLVIVTHYDGDVGSGGAVFSPDGRWILFRRQNGAAGTYAIWKMHSDGTDATLIRRIGVNFCCLAWGPRAA